MKIFFVTIFIIALSVSVYADDEWESGVKLSDVAIVQYNGISEPSQSDMGNARLYFDSTELMISKDGAAYEPIVSGNNPVIDGSLSVGIDLTVTRDLYVGRDSRHVTDGDMYLGDDDNSLITYSSDNLHVRPAEVVDLPTPIQILYNDDANIYSGASLKDSSGNNYHAKLVKSNMSYVGNTGAKIQADDFIVTTAMKNADFTLSFYFFVTNVSGGTDRTAWVFGGDTVWERFGIRYDNAKMHVAPYGQDNSFSIQWTMAVTNNTIYNITLVYETDGSYCTGYINGGAPRAVAGVTRREVRQVYGTRIGSEYNAHYVGMVDVKSWSRALTAGQVVAEYKAPDAPTAEMIDYLYCWIPFCEGSGNVYNVMDSRHTFSMAYGAWTDVWNGDTQDLSHYNIKYGFTEEVSGDKVPFTYDGVAISGSGTEKPAGTFHNDAETEIELNPSDRTVIADAIGADAGESYTYDELYDYWNTEGDGDFTLDAGTNAKSNMRTYSTKVRFPSSGLRHTGKTTRRPHSFLSNQEVIRVAHTP